MEGKGSALLAVQARLGSRRFPQKILAPILGQPMLLRVLERLSVVFRPEQIIVIVPHCDRDTLMPFVHKHGYQCSAPDVPEDDVLARYASIAGSCTKRKIVRVTADCPLVDAHVIAQALPLYWDYTAISGEWADGLDFEVFDREFLLTIAKESDKPYQREHVSPFVFEKYAMHIKLVPCPLDLSLDTWSVDTPDDLALVRRIYEELYPRYGATFGWQHIHGLVETAPWAQAYREARSPYKRNRAYLDQVGSNKTWQEERYAGLASQQASADIVF